MYNLMILYNSEIFQVLHKVKSDLQLLHHSSGTPFPNNQALFYYRMEPLLYQTKPSLFLLGFLPLICVLVSLVESRW